MNGIENAVSKIDRIVNGRPFLFYCIMEAHLIWIQSTLSFTFFKFPSFQRNENIVSDVTYIKAFHKLSNGDVSMSKRVVNNIDFLVIDTLSSEFGSGFQN